MSATSLDAGIITAAHTGTVVTTPANADKVNGNTVTNTRGKLILLVTNNNAGSDAITATFDVTKTIAEGGSTIPAQDTAVAIAAGATKVIGPFSSNYETAGKIGITWSGDALAAEIDVTPILLP